MGAERPQPVGVVLAQLSADEASPEGADLLSSTWRDVDEWMRRPEEAVDP